MKSLLALLMLMSVASSFAMSEEDEFIISTQEELNLPAEAIPEMQAEFNQNADHYIKSRTLFCTGSGFGVIIDGASFRCRNFKGEKIQLSMIGLGVSIGVHAGVAILHAKKGSRNFKEGTYSASLGAIQLGLGIMGISIRNQNESINWKLKGVTVGIGLNAAASIVTVTKIQ